MPDYASKINIDGTEILLKGVPAPVVSRGVDGLCPALPSGSGTTKYLREDGTWVVPPNSSYGVVSKTANGLCPQLPNETTTTKYLRQDGSWVVPPNTTYSTFTRSANGLVPASGGSTTTRYLREDGSWVAPPNTTYNIVSKTANGLCPQLPNETATTKYLRQDGTWVKPPDTNYIYAVETVEVPYYNNRYCIKNITTPSGAIVIGSIGQNTNETITNLFITKTTATKAEIRVIGNFTSGQTVRINYVIFTS